MDDLIKRQDAIDEIVTWTVEDRPDVEMPTDLIGRIKALLSAEPEPLTLETYTLVLYHNILFGGEELKVEDPIAIKYTVQLSDGGSSYMINEMMDRMKHEVLCRFNKKGV